MSERLTVTFRRDPFRRPGWVTMGLDLDGAEGRREPVHVANMVACLDALRSQAAVGRMSSLGRASELVVEPGTVRGHLTNHHDGAVVQFSVPPAPAASAGLVAGMERVLA